MELLDDAAVLFDMASDICRVSLLNAFINRLVTTSLSLLLKAVPVSEHAMNSAR